MQARYYDPVIGRFYSNDPVDATTFLSQGNVHGFNRYAYANNNPYKYIDPDGRAGQLAGCLGGPIACGVAVALTGYGAYKLYASADDAVEKTEKAMEDVSARTEAVNNQYDLLEGLLDGTAEMSDINESVSEVAESTETAVDSIGEAGKAVSQLPGTSMSGPAPLSQRDLQNAGAAEVVKETVNNKEEENR